MNSNNKLLCTDFNFLILKKAKGLFQLFIHVVTANK